MSEYLGGVRKREAGDDAGKCVRALGRALLSFSIKGSPRHPSQNLRVIQYLSGLHVAHA